MHSQKRLLFFCLVATIIDMIRLSQSSHASSLNLTKIINDKIDCNNKRDIIDDCGMQQGYPFKFKQFALPVDQIELKKGCVRQADAFKCLRLYSKCLSPLTKQILLAMINTRSKFSKRLCAEKPSEFSESFLQLGICMTKAGLNMQKGLEADIAAVRLAESIVNAKLDKYDDRLKYSCCAVAQVKEIYLKSARPQCSKHVGIFGELIDSYLAETVSIICPNGSSEEECKKLAKLAQVNKTDAKYFVRPMLDVINLLE